MRPEGRDTLQLEVLEPSEPKREDNELKKMEGLGSILNPNDP